jgi:hypothetical protein
MRCGRLRGGRQAAARDIPDKEVEQGMHLFDGDDNGYLARVGANPDGYVVNSLRQPRADYLILHRATCKSISRTPPEPIRWTTGDYIKVCSPNILKLEQWARDATSGTLSPCGLCRPLASALADEGAANRR